MVPAGSAAERTAPAALGSTLSQAVFFIDRDIGWGFIQAVPLFDRVLAGLRRRPHDESGAGPRPVMLSEIDQTSLQIAIDVFGIVQRQLMDGALIANGTSGGDRFDFPRDVWRRPIESISDLDHWLRSTRPPDGDCPFLQIRVRPRYAVENEKAALATGEFADVVSYLKGGMSEAWRGALVMQPLNDAVQAGLIDRACARTVQFRESLESPAPVRPAPPNPKRKPGRPAILDLTPAFQAAKRLVDQMQRETSGFDPCRRGIHAQITRVMTEAMIGPDGEDLAGQTRIKQAAAEFLDDLKARRNGR